MKHTVEIEFPLIASVPDEAAARTIMDVIRLLNIKGVQSTRIGFDGFNYHYMFHMGSFNSIPENVKLARETQMRCRA